MSVFRVIDKCLYHEIFISAPGVTCEPPSEFQLCLSVDPMVICDIPAISADSEFFLYDIIDLTAGRMEVEKPL